MLTRAEIRRSSGGGNEGSRGDITFACGDITFNQLNQFKYLGPLVIGTKDIRLELRNIPGRNA